jgi:transposase-like protein
MTSISRTDLAKLYDVCSKTLYTWLKEANIELRKGYGLTREEQQKIFEMFGDPKLSISRTALIDKYGINRKTLYNWLKEANITLYKGCAICQKDQQIIYDLFGNPDEYKQRKQEKKVRKEMEKKLKRR